MSSAIEAAFEEFYTMRPMMHLTSYEQGLLCFAEGIAHAAKANTELIKEYQETMEKIDEDDK